MEENKQPEVLDQQEVTCKQCGSRLKFEPGTKSAKCTNCGTENEIQIDRTKLMDALKEIDYLKFVQDASNVEIPREEQSFVKCTSCGAETTIDSRVISAECAFCGSPLVKDQTQIKSLITPSAVLPFKISQKDAIEAFHKWMKKIWFLPNKARQYAKPDKFQGIYTPYWTYDANTSNYYQGQRGDDYHRTETYRDSSGNTQTRTVTETRWTSVSGTVMDMFDDILVVASSTLPTKHVTNLEPWNLAELAPYDRKYLTGFKAESYDKDVKGGFEVAKTIMEKSIESHIRQDIGGDHQRILTKNVNYNRVTFKHVLLPIWLSTYRYNDKVYRFVVNGQTGKVKGERPVSAGKVILFILVIVAIITGIILLAQYL